MCVAIFGGSGAIGGASARIIAASGVPVYVTYRHSEAAAHAVVRSIETDGGRAAHGACDLLQRDSIAHALVAAADALGPVKGIVFASGPHVPQHYLGDIAPADFDAIMQTDVRGFFNLAQLALPVLRASGGGSLVAVTTMAVTSAPPKDGLSAIPKSAVEMMCRVIAREEGRYGIRANCVAPGFVLAGAGQKIMSETYSAEVWDRQKARVALRRFADVEEVGEVVAFLASDKSSYVTGQTILVDGGFSL
jgi:2-hydroxycyclohexanecarboxyl-CoA dehydrogenase